MKLFYKLLPVIFIFSSLSFMEPDISAQKFEGEILFKNKTGLNVDYTRYFVKGCLVRVESLNHKKEVISYYIINTSNTESDFVNPHQKIYKHETKRRKLPVPENQNFSISKTGNSKQINGQKCHQWIVLNREKETKVMYWLSDSGVNCFGDIMAILNSTERTAYYYLQIPKSNSRNIFPLEIEEFSLTRERRITITLEQMKKKKLNASFFEVPKGYKIIH